MSFPFEDYPKSGQPGKKMTLNAPYAFNTPSSISMFAAKIDLYLRANKFEYDFSPTIPGDKKKTPRDKVPSLQYGDIVVPDSHFIIKFLENTYGDQLEVKSVTDKEQHGKALAAQSMCENYVTYAVLPFMAYTDQAFLEFQKNPSLLKIPKLLRSTVLKRVVKPKLKKTAHVLGFRHSEKDTIELLKEQALGLSELLGDKPYFGGERFCKEDCSIWGCMQAVLCQTISPTVKDIFAEHSNLVEYKDRIQKMYFPDSNPSPIKVVTDEFLKTKGQ